MVVVAVLLFVDDDGIFVVIMIIVAWHRPVKKIKIEVSRFCFHIKFILYFLCMHFIFQAQKRAAEEEEREARERQQELAAKKVPQ